MQLDGTSEDSKRQLNETVYWVSEKMNRFGIQSKKKNTLT